MAVELPANVDESILTFDQDGFLGSSVLVQMGIKINKPNVETRITELVQRFNETYLETLDFLTQILPLAREQFGRSDNLLLPKTPSKKRHRKIVQDLCNQENCSPNIQPQLLEKRPPVKRTTRSSRRNNPVPTGEERVTRQTRSTRSQAKKLEASVDHCKVAFVDDKMVSDVEMTPDKSSESSASTTKTLKRTSSISPDSVKPVRKKSKSSDELIIIDNGNLPEEQTSTPVSTHPPQAFLFSRSLNIDDENDEAKSEILVKGEDDVKIDAGMNRKNEPQTSILVTIGDDNNAMNNTTKEHEVVSPVASTLPPATVLTKPKTLSLDKTVDKVTVVVAESPITKVPEESVNEYVTNDTPGKIAEMVVDIDMSGGKITDKVNNNLPTEAELSRNTEPAAQLMEQQTTEQECTEKPLRRSKRLSKQINFNEPDLEILPKQSNEELPVTVNEPASTDEVESTSDSQDEAPAKTVVLETAKPVRRSTRLSRRISKVSTGYTRRSSRRSSRCSGYFKKPTALRQVEVQLDDVGINEFVRPSSEFSGNKDLHKEVLSNSEHSSAESEDDGPRISSALPANTSQHSSKTDSSGDEMAQQTVGRVAGLVRQINKNNLLDERTSLHNTPSGIRKIKRIGSAVLGSSKRPSNLVGGNVKSFIKRQSVKKLDPNEVVRQRKLELQRKEEKDKERKDQAELRKKIWVEEQKRKREEKQKRVAEAKAAREREEQDKKQRQLEERRQMLHASEQAKKKREHEEETKKKLREQRTKEAEARRVKENEERLKRLQEKEEEEKMYREMLKRKQEMEEQERKQRIQEEKRLYEQKQRERAREKEEERERRLREIKEKEAKRIEKEGAGEVERKEDKEKKQKEHEDREKTRVCQLIKDRLEQERKLLEQRLQIEEKERRDREEQRKREAVKAAMLQNARTADSYLMTPPPAQTRKPATSENYDISDIRSDESTDDEDAPRKKVPYWAQGAALKSALLQQDGPRRVFEELASGFVPHAPDLEKIFTKKRKRFYQRTSSAHWSSPPIKV